MKKKILVIFLAFLFFCSNALASKVWEGQNSQSIFNTAKAEYAEALNNYRLAREEYLKALNKYKTLQCKEENQNCKEQKNQAIDKAKQYLLKIKDTMAKYLTVLRTKIENMEIDSEEKTKIINSINQDLNFLDTKEQEIKNIQTAEQIVSFMPVFKTFWTDEEAKVKKYIGQIILWKLEKVTAKEEEISVKITEKITSLGKDGYDVLALQKSLDSIKNNLKIAKEKETLLKTIIIDPARFEEVKTNSKEIAQILKKNYEDLKNLAKELDKNKLNKKETKNNETDNRGISIKGEGYININGDGTVSGKIGDESFPGTLTILNKDNNVEIETFGKGEKAEMGDGRIQYKGVDKIQIKGTNLLLEVSSQLIDLEFKGKGIALMKGNGLYKVFGSEWTDIPKSEIKIEF